MACETAIDGALTLFIPLVEKKLAVTPLAIEI